MNKNNPTQINLQNQHNIETGLSEKNSDNFSFENNNENNKINFHENADQIATQLKKAQEKIENATKSFIPRNIERTKTNLSAPEYEVTGPQTPDPDTPINVESFDQLYQRVAEKYGDILYIEDKSALGVYEQLLYLDRLPTNLVDFLNRAKLKINLISNPPENVANYYYQVGNTNVNLRNTYGYAFYYGSTRNCYITSTLELLYQSSELYGSGTSSGVLHEIGHGCHDILPIDLSTLKKAHLRLYDKLGWYYRQGGPGGITGVKEFFAESFSDFFVYTKPEFVARYDEEWYDEIHRLVNIDYDKISKYDPPYSRNKPGDLIKFTKSSYQYAPSFTQQDLDAIE